MDRDTELGESGFQWTQHELDRGPIVHDGFVPQDGDNGEYGVEDNESPIANGSGSYADEPMDDIFGTEGDDYLHDDAPDPDDSTSEDDYSISNGGSTYVIPALAVFISLTSL